MILKHKQEKLKSRTYNKNNVKESKKMVIAPCDGEANGGFVIDRASD
jgi:hypothetical protein